LHSAKKPNLIVVSSPSSGDGKTITSINVAASLSLKENMSVLLVDADLRRPSVAELLGLPSAPGIADVLSGRVNLTSAVVRARELPNLCILPAGDAGQSAAELLHSERWPGIIAQFRSQFNVVIMDATPIAVVADYELLQQIADGVIIVVRPDHTDRKACLSALKSIPKEKFIGVVVNCVKDSWLSKTPDYGYYRKLSAKASGTR
jgi:capsular exopolysaccharide synthesis family protein